MDTTFTANPSVPWLTVSPKDGKIAADGSTDTKVYISVDWSQVPAPSSNQSFSAVGNVDFTSSDGAMMTATVPINKIPWLHRTCSTGKSRATDVW